MRENIDVTNGWTTHLGICVQCDTMSILVLAECNPFVWDLEHFLCLDCFVRNRERVYEDLTHNDSD